MNGIWLEFIELYRSGALSKVRCHWSIEKLFVPLIRMPLIRGYSSAKKAWQEGCYSAPSI